MPEDERQEGVAAFVTEVINRMEGTTVREVLARRAQAGDELAADMLACARKHFLERSNALKH
jgi:hypothetical protein